MNKPFFPLLFAVFAAILAGSCSKNDAPIGTEKTLYTCGMHKQIIKDKPGNCPICGMKLQPIRKEPGSDLDKKTAVAASGERKIKFYKSTMTLGEISQTPRKDSMGMDMVPVYEDESTDSATIRIDPVTIQNMGVRTGVVSKGPLRRAIRTVGVVDYNETALADITTKFKGWIEKLYVDSVGKAVKKGEPLFEIYSPDLYSAQREYLIATKQGGNPENRTSALTRLRYFDVPQEQIDELVKTGEVRKALRVNVPTDGIVLEKMAVEGQMVEAGMKLFRIADLSVVWVQAQIYEQDLPLMHLGQEATVSLSYYPDRKFGGRVTYIYPTVDEKTRTAKVRMEFHNPGLFLKPGMFVTVEATAELAPDALLVPDTAILRSGEKNTVFVALEGGKFDPRHVVIGARSDNNMYQVLSGLNEGERVVTSGQFMLDSESQLREAIQKMLSPDAPANTQEQPQQAGPTPTATAVAAESKEANQEYVCPEGYDCPMPEHMNISYNHGGKCPICGMTLIPGKAVVPAASPTPVLEQHSH